MSGWLAFALVLALAAVAFVLAQARAARLGPERPHSLPFYHGMHSALWVLVPAALVLGTWGLAGGSVIRHQVLASVPAGELPEGSAARQVYLAQISELSRAGPDSEVAAIASPALRNAAAQYRALESQAGWTMGLLALLIGACGLGYSLMRIRPAFRARTAVEQFVMLLLVVASVVAVLTTVGIVGSLIFESLRFFEKVPFLDFVTGLVWSPQTAIRADQVGSSGAFGAVPLFTGTLLITAIAMVFAVPIGLLSAVYLTQYATPRVRAILKPVLEILAGVPTVVYGFFAALTVAPALRAFGESIGLTVASESALAAGGVMGVMIIPFMSSLSDDAITAVPQAMKDGSLAMGATVSETIRQVLVPAALPGIVGGFLLAVSRAIGETMIVVMAAGLAANLTFNPLASVTTVTAQIVALLTGDQEFDSPKTLSAFALGMVLFVVTLCLNIYALYVVRRYREAYE